MERHAPGFAKVGVQSAYRWSVLPHPKAACTAAPPPTAVPIAPVFRRELPWAVVLIHPDLCEKEAMKKQEERLGGQWS